MRSVRKKVKDNKKADTELKRICWKISIVSKIKDKQGLKG